MDGYPFWLHVRIRNVFVKNYKNVHKSKRGHGRVFVNLYVVRMLSFFFHNVTLIKID